MKMKNQIIYGIFVFLCIKWTCSALSFTFEVARRDTMCFYETYNNEKHLEFRYEVMEGGKLDIDVLVNITDPDRPAKPKNLYNETRKTFGLYEFEGLKLNGELAFCFNNRFSTLSYKMIYFELLDWESLTQSAGDDKNTTARTQMEVSLENIKLSTAQIELSQARRALPKRRDAHQARQLGESVKKWAIIHTGLLLFTGFGQVWALRRLFTVTRDPKSGASKIPGSL